MAARAGLARELFEETGIDVRANVERLQPAVLRAGPEVDKNEKTLLINEHKNRFFFLLRITDEDFFKVQYYSMIVDN